VKLNPETSYVKMGLLTPKELAILLPMKNKMRDTVCAWISSEIQQGIYSGILNPACQTTCLDNVCFLRAKMAAFHDQFNTNQPALYASLMVFVVDVLIFLLLLGAPVQLFVHGTSQCFQWWVVLGVMLITLPFLCTSTIIKLLQQPYHRDHVDDHGDVFNVDALMGSTEQCIFASLRSRFDFNGTELEDRSRPEQFDGQGPELSYCVRSGASGTRGSRCAA